MKLFLPENFDNSVKYNKVFLYLFIIITIFTVGRSIAHILLPDGGANSIATIMVFVGSPDPNQVIYFIFGLWGISQLMMALIYVLSIIRYRSMVPLCYIMVWLEYLLRLLLGQLIKPLSEDVMLGVAPGSVGNYIALIIVTLVIIKMVLDYRFGQLRQK